MGFKIKDDVPDFRLDHAISFKRKGKSSVQKRALISVIIGDSRNQNVELKSGHCIILGRLVSDHNPDMTFVGKPDFNSLTHFTRIDSDHEKLIEKYLDQGKPKSQSPKKEAISPRFLGDYVRDADFLIDDSAISRTHIILYQDDENVRILDLVSKNGTYVNGKEIESYALKNNDVLSVGTSSLRINYL